MVSAQTPEEIIVRFAALLDGAGIPYMLTGSLACGFHGTPRATQDIDLVIAPTRPRSSACSAHSPATGTT